MDRIKVDVALTNEDKGYRFSDFSETLDDVTVGEIFREAQREWGRCMGKVYVDREGHPEPIHVGWYFESRQPYEDARRRDDTYIRGAWVTFALVDEDDA